MTGRGDGRPVYRVEWRETADVGTEPSFAMWRRAPGGAEARSLAMALSASGIVHMDEFHVAVITPGGQAERVLTDLVSIVAWDPSVEPLPKVVSTGSWASELERGDAAIDLLETVRMATARAYAAGSMERSAARRLMADMRSALDDEEEDPDGSA